jgi:HEAT repeat protein
MRRASLLAIITLAAAIAASAIPAAAQQSARAVDRYNRVARGANIDEWHKRLFDPDPSVRMEGVESLGEDGTLDSVKPLLDATSDADPRVRSMAIDYLGQIGSPQATQVLTQYLFLSDTDKNSKQHVLVALGRIKDPTSVRALTAFTENTDDEKLRCSAIHALGEIGGTKALAIVEPYSEEPFDVHVRRIANDAVKKITQQLAAAPKNRQPSIIELERQFAPPPQQRR